MLHLDEDEVFSTRIRDSVRHTCRHINRSSKPDADGQFVDGGSSFSPNHEPVLGTVLVDLVAQPLTWEDGYSLHLMVESLV